MNPGILAVLTVTLSGDVRVSVSVSETTIREIWKDVAEVTNAPANIQMPKKIRFISTMSWWTRFRSRTTAKNGAIYRAIYLSPISEIEFYIKNFQKSIWKHEKTLKWTGGDIEASCYYTLAHEMLHHVFTLSGIPGREQHACMEEGKYLISIMNRIDARLLKTGMAAPAARSFAINSLRYGIRLDQLPENQP